MSRIATNFRGLRALILHGPGATSDRLAEILERLGLVVMIRSPEATSSGDPPDCDLLLFDADEEIEARLVDETREHVPTIALIGNEAPSRLSRVVGFRCNSHIIKPIRSTGVYSAVLLAINDHARRRQTDRELAAFRQRLSGRRFVMKAVLKKMDLCGIDEDAAYEHLRRRAMELRVPIETVAKTVLDAAETEELSPVRRRHNKA